MGKILMILQMSLAVLSTLAWAKNLPECTLNPNATSNKCANVTCLSLSECQSYMCTGVNSVCAPCNNDETAPMGRCELLSCRFDSDCNFRTCFNGRCDFLGKINDTWNNVFSFLLTVILVPVFVVGLVVGICVFCIMRAKGMRRRKNYDVIIADLNRQLSEQHQESRQGLI